MRSTYTWLDFFCWNHHSDLVNVFFSEHLSEFIMIYLTEINLLLSVPICTRGES